MEQLVLVSLVFWPLVVIGCALLNMLLHWSFSWSELILDYFAGVIIGLCFWYGTEADAGGAAKFFLVFSQGLFGLLHAVDAGLSERASLFAWSAGGLGAAVLLAGLLDLATRHIGSTVWAGILSIAIFPLKAPFSLVTTGVGYLMFVVGVVVAMARANTHVGFIGGVPYVEWSSGGSDQATTLGATVQVWSGSMSGVLQHELYHTRQYMYLHDWLIPFWLVGGIWGLLSAAIHKAADSSYAISFAHFYAADHQREVGNPIERAAYAADGSSPV